MWNTRITERLNIDYPIIQAPMAGGPTSADLVAAVANAGGLGMIGAGYMSPDQIKNLIREVKKKTVHPFGVNLFVPAPYDAGVQEIQNAKENLKPFQARLGIQDNTCILPTYENDLRIFLEQIQIVINEKVPVCSFTFGLPSEEVISKLKQEGIVVIGTATTVREAVLIEQAGLDAVVAQGSEAGGHRGTFNGDFKDSLIGLMSLIPQVCDTVKIPVIAAGGIMDGRGVLAAKVLGADAVQLGTAFLATHESGAQTIYKDALLKATEDQTALTRAFSGKPARGLKNKFISEMNGTEIPAYPIQNELTKGIRKAASDHNNPDYLSMWSGQSARLAKKSSVRELLAEIISQAEAEAKSLRI